ncbi:monovalent cation/H+ antiporter complex subunit F [Streptomyces sp. ACA25]|uniref:MrpF/PhaF family protein n=1 Tax=Streptomyces sp. ACA25 TaxID=3022596 RepID=UPI002307E027|nr:monovalent cation/H+ antiporter complex subunit F [Streptomyces sp. ACA25]MDB1087725.1 monovalent cation/H+ antiporter complex subunit F [Streptomyces sp. ACA25]
MQLLDVALLVLVLSLATAIVQVVRGPTGAERLVAADFGFVAFVAGVAVLAVRLESPALFDLVLVATLAGYLATVALARLLERRRAP